MVPCFIMYIFDNKANSQSAQPINRISDIQRKTKQKMRVKSFKIHIAKTMDL